MSEYIDVEKPLLAQLVELGWETIDQGEGVPTDPFVSLRSCFTQHFLPEVLRAAIKRLNPWLTSAQVDQWFEKAANLLPEKGIMERHEAAYRWLTSNERVDTDEATREYRVVRLIDFDESTNNTYHAINQFKIDLPGQLKGIRPDTVLFINGLAVVVIEAKHPTACESPVDEGIEQILRYSNQRGSKTKEGCESLFVFNALNISTCREQARYGAVCATSRHYYTWRDPFPHEIGKLNQQEILILSTCEPKRLLDLIENFSAIVEEDGFKYKVVARYQQYRTVIKQIARLRGTKGKGRNGTVWHTTGSGKSITMMFLVRKLRRTADLKDFKVILVVDRIDLERQLKETAKLAHETITRIENRNELNNLKTQTANLNIVMVHKFIEPTSQTKNQLLAGAVPFVAPQEIINTSDRILVMVDEAHRSQGGDMGDNLLNSFPNAVLVGFTGTPLLKDEKKTSSRFGEYIDIYTPKESIEDGTTVPLRYLGKTVSTAISKRQSLTREFENLVSGVSEEDKKRIVQKYGTFDAYLESEERIQMIADDIVEHYASSVFPNRFKAQIVTSSKRAAHLYRLAVEKALVREVTRLRDSGYSHEADELAKVYAAVVISADGTNEESWVTEERQRTREMNAIETFKQKFKVAEPKTYLSFLIVCDMLITGFDAPIEQVLYLDKILKEHTLLQAIARANRVAEGKTHGLIVDYIGVFENLARAFEMYEEAAQKQILDGIENIEDEVPKARARLTLVTQFFEKRGLKGVYEFLHQQDKEIDPEAVQETMIQVLEKQDAREGLGQLARLFFQSVDMLLPDPLANEFKPAVKRLGGILAIAKLRYQERTSSISWAGRKVRELINSHLVAIDIDVAIEPVDLLDADFAKLLGKQHGSRAVASTMQHAIVKRARIGIEQGDTWYKPFLEQVESLIERYDSHWDELIEKFKEIESQIRNHEGSDTPKYILEGNLGEILGVNVYENPEALLHFQELVKGMDEQRKKTLPDGSSPYGKPILEKETKTGLRVYLFSQNKSNPVLSDMGMEQANEIVNFYLKHYADQLAK